MKARPLEALLRVREHALEIARAKLARTASVLRVAKCTLEGVERIRHERVAELAGLEPGTGRSVEELASFARWAAALRLRRDEACAAAQEARAGVEYLHAELSRSSCGVAMARLARRAAADERDRRRVAQGRAREASRERDLEDLAFAPTQRSSNVCRPR